MKEGRVRQGQSASEQPTPNAAELSLAAWHQLMCQPGSPDTFSSLGHRNGGRSIRSAYAVLRLSFSPPISLSFPALSTFVFLVSFEITVSIICKQTSWQVVQP